MTLKLGSGTGSLINHVISGDRNPLPEVGMGATLLMWTDRHALTIVGVNKDKTTIIVQRDTAKRTDDRGPFTEGQDYTFEANPDATKETYTLRKNGAWVRKGESMINGSRISIGSRSEYRDPSF